MVSDELMMLGLVLLSFGIGIMVVAIILILRPRPVSTGRRPTVDDGPVTPIRVKRSELWKYPKIDMRSKHASPNNDRMKDRQIEVRDPVRFYDLTGQQPSKRSKRK